jgi:predicted Ser/Thr protein kinase
VFELAEVAYGPRPESGTEEFTEALKKRRMDAAGKNLGKRARVLKKKKMETMKASMPHGKPTTP